MDFTDGLDAAQRAGVLSGEGLVIMPSGAGTGKTRVLTTRIAYLVHERGAEPESVLAVTFTKKAAREMKERAQLIGGEAVKDVRIQTIHSLSAHLIRRYWKEAGLPTRKWSIITSAEREEMLSRALTSTGVWPLSDVVEPYQEEDRKNRIALCAEHIDRWKENGLSAEDVEDPNRPRLSGLEEDNLKVYVAYAAEMASSGALEFSDLSLLAVRLLETHPEILMDEASAIKWMMVDEAQDVNRIQVRLIALLSSVSGNLFVVGDDDQSLYSFRGAIKSFMATARTLFPVPASKGHETVRLVTNRRCTDQILAPANRLVDYNERDEPKVLRSGRIGASVAVSGYPNDRLESKAIVDKVSALIAKGVKPGDIAILGRTKFSLQSVERAFIKAQVPHCMHAGTGFLERSEVQDVLAYLRLAQNPHAEQSFIRIAARPVRGLGAAAVTAITGLARGRGLAIHEALAQCVDAKVFRGKANKEAVSLSQHLSTLAHAATFSEPSRSLVQYVLNDVGYREWALAAKGAPWTLAGSLSGLMEMAEEEPDFELFMSDLCLLVDQEETSPNSVHIGTLHGSKGLEWDYVFLPAFEEGILPSRQAMLAGERARDASNPWETETAGGLEEERRLAHVGLTRAKTGAFVSFSLERGNGRMAKEAKPSRFLHESELGVPEVRRSFNALVADTKRSAPPKGKKRMKYV